ncbi:MAG TPA: CHC2 zinc finger domain-containing protein [Polyangiaceae bacterium]|nr:CHC2 zinc finger domain-containing protein [Polyangiaceae bacterium]
MARISEAEIERLKSGISLQRLAEARGVRLKRHGADLLGLCPFHDDREPSLVISPEKNLWHCLGACQAGGTVIDWVMRAEAVSFRYAVELLRTEHSSLVAGSNAPATARFVKKSTVQKLPTIAEQAHDDAEVFEHVVSYYQETLAASPEALAYLEKRGINNAEAVSRFRLGFANRTLAYRLPQKNRKTGAELRSQMQRLGVLRESGHEHLNGSLVIPVFDEQGRVTEMYGRKINENLREGTPRHLYLPGPHRGVWNESALAESKEIILCESLIDALTFWCAGFRNVTASYGVEGFTEDHRAAFRKHGTERVLIAYDRDEAGDRAAEKLAVELSTMGIEVLRVLFPKNMDANSYALKVQPAAQSLGLVLRKAEWMAGTRRAAPSVTASAAAPAALAEPVPVAPAEPVPASEPTPPAAAPPQQPPPALSKAEPDAAPAPAMTAREIFSLAAELGAAVADEDATKQPKTAPAAPPRSPSPAAPPAAEGEQVFRLGERRWRVRGLSKTATPGSLKVNLLCSREGGGFHVDTLELYSARQRAAFLKQAAEELGLEERILKKDLGEVLQRLEEQQEQAARAEHQEKKQIELSDAERREALEFLRDPRLCERLLEDFQKCGVVGEETNKLTAYLAATSRKLDQPLAVIIQSSSAAGKSSLMDAVLALMPEEERVEYSAMTGQSLFYMSESDLKHKILAIVEEEGAERASYALKLLQSEGELTIASTGKDPATGRLITQEYRVEGPVMIFLTTTAIEVDDELLNRCLVLTVDEGREQTRAIHGRQREAQTLEGLIAKRERTRIERLHQNAQRLIRPLLVSNPYARELTFLDHQTRSRRDFPKYLTLIRTVALLHQYQREVKEHEHRGEVLRYIEVTREDIALANRLAHEVLGRSLDELPPQTRRLHGLVDELVTEGAKQQGVDRSDFRFSRRQVRERTGWGDTQLRIHLGRLLELELLVMHRGRQGQSYLYELVASPSADGVFLPGLVDAEQLSAAASTTTSRGSGPNFAGVVRGGSGPVAGDARGAAEKGIELKTSTTAQNDPPHSETTRTGARANGTPYVAASAASPAPAAPRRPALTAVG